MNAKKTTQRQGFKTSEFIVYPAHGVGQITAIEEQEVAGARLAVRVRNEVDLFACTWRGHGGRSLRQGTGRPADCVGDSLDRLAGTWSEEESQDFLGAVEACEMVDEPLWR